MKTRFSPDVRSFLLTLIAGVCLAGVCATGAEITVDTDKTAYTPGAPVQVTVTLRDVKQAVSGTLRLEVRAGLDSQWELLDEPVDLKPGDTWTRQATWTSPSDDLWGCEARAVLTQGEKTTKANHVFVVTDNIIKAAANMTGVSKGYFKTGAGDPIAHGYKQWHRLGMPFVEAFCWVPSNWGYINPTTDEWICGQMLYRVRTSDIQLLVDHAHKLGMFISTYARITYTGADGYRWAREHPESVWFRKPDGKLLPFSDEELAMWDKAAKDPTHPVARHGKGLRKLKRWQMLVRVDDDATLDEGLDQYIAVIKRFGFDGIRWDNHPFYLYTPQSDWNLRGCSGGKVTLMGYDQDGKADIAPNPTTESLRIIRRYKQRILKALPNLKLGYNIQAVNSVYPLSEELVINGRAADWAELVPGAVIWDEKHFVSLPGSSRPAGMHTDWTRTRNAWLRGNLMVTRQGGYHYTGSMPNRGAEAFLRHAYSLAYACGARGAGVAKATVNVEGPMAELIKFSQRYAYYLFHPDAKIMDLSKNSPFNKRVVVKANRPVVWQPLVKTIADKGQFTIVVNLWNQPLQEKMKVNECEAPPAVKSTTVRITQPLGLSHKDVKVFVLSPDWPTWQQPVTVDSSGKSLSIKVPEFQYWAVVVAQYPMKAAD